MPATLFDKHASEQAKAAGMLLAAERRDDVLQVARRIAREIATQRPDGITADDLVQELVRRGHGVHCLGNAAGSLFRGPEWEFTGQRKKSARVHAHANKLKVWRLR